MYKIQRLSDGTLLVGVKGHLSGGLAFDPFDDDAYETVVHLFQAMVEARQSGQPVGSQPSFVKRLLSKLSA